jgi:chromosome segregation ATPase
LRSVRELCLRSGYRIEEIRRTKADLFSASPLLPQVNAEDFDAALVAEILSDPEHDTVQFIVKVVPLSDDQKIADIVSNISEIETKLRVANEQNERLQSALDAQRGELAALVAWNNQLAAHRESDREALRAELEQVQMLAESERETFAAAFAEHRAIFEGEYRNELDAVTKELNARRQDVSAFQAALNAAQAEHQVMSADLRGYEARLAEIGAIRVLSSELQVQNTALRADLESGREHYLKLAAELESEKERSRDFALDAESERLSHAAWAKDATERAERLETELKAAREERAQLEAFALELTRRETEKIREEIALLDQAIRETYSSRIWRLKLRIGRLRERFRKA